MKKKLSSVSSIIILASIFLLFFGCSSSSRDLKFSSADSEKTWMEKFFKDLLLEESGVFTLWGTKPMTVFDICLYSSEEIREMQKNHPMIVEEETIELKNYDFPANWENWEKNRHRFPLHGFLLFKVENSEDPKLPNIYFVNILQTALVIEQNYHLFRKAVGKDFDALTVVLDMEKLHSDFWQPIFKNAQLVGLLYGFGLKNASCFAWKYRNQEGNHVTFSNTLQHSFSDSIKSIGDATVQHFPIPIFASFFPDDEMQNRYIAERNEIRKIYRKRDFVDVTLQKLTNVK